MHISLDGNVGFVVVSVLRMLFTFAFVMLMKRIVTDTEYSTCMHTQCKFSCATAAADAVVMTETHRARENFNIYTNYCVRHTVKSVSLTLR